MKSQQNEFLKVKIGDVFRSSWGYDQTNINYFQVVGLRGKVTLELREIAADVVENHYSSGRCVPVIDCFISDEIIRRRLSKTGHIKIDTVRTASKKEYKRVSGVKVFNSDYWSHDY